MDASNRLAFAVWMNGSSDGCDVGGAGGFCASAVALRLVTMSVAVSASFVKTARDIRNILRSTSARRLWRGHRGLGLCGDLLNESDELAPIT
jgi:hypothetical protein